MSSSCSSKLYSPIAFCCFEPYWLRFTGHLYYVRDLTFIALFCLLLPLTRCIMTVLQTRNLRPKDLINLPEVIKLLTGMDT